MPFSLKNLLMTIWWRTGQQIFTCMCSRFCNQRYLEASNDRVTLQEQVNKAIPQSFQNSIFCSGKKLQQIPFNHLTSALNHGNLGYQVDDYGSCVGDSGSPVVQFETDNSEQGHYVQVWICFFVGLFYFDIYCI